MTEAVTKRTRTVPILAQISKLEAARDAAMAAFEAAEAKLRELCPLAAEEHARAQRLMLIEQQGLSAGTDVRFVYGRADKRRTLAGVVAAFAPASEALPARYKVSVGQGIDQELYTVPARDILSVGVDEPAPEVLA